MLENSTSVKVVTRLFVNNRKDELGDRLGLMAVGTWRQSLDKLLYVCRSNLCCYTTNRVTQIANVRLSTRLQKVS